MLMLDFRGLRKNQHTGKSMVIENKFEEQLVQKFSYRCPYCNEPISYDQFNLKVGDNEIQCPSCKKIYIKIITDVSDEKKRT